MNDEKLQKLAEELVYNPKAAYLTAALLYENAKLKAKRVTEMSRKNIKEANVTDEIPTSVLQYLRKAKNVSKFFAKVRDRIILSLETEEFSDEEIALFIDYFTPKYLELVIDKTSCLNCKKLKVMVILDKCGITFDEDRTEFLKNFRMIWSTFED